MAKPFFAHTKLGAAMVSDGWSVSELSYETRINPRLLGHYLKGDKQINPDHLRAISHAMRVDPRDLFQTQMELATLKPHQDHLLARQSVGELRRYGSIPDADMESDTV
jgi:transcriptional regulator with XRE-family HTH domain